MDNPSPHQLSKKELRDQRRQEHLSKAMQSSHGRRVGQVIFWIIIVLIIGATIFAVSYFAKQGGSNEPIEMQDGEAGVIPPLTATDHIKGDVEAKVVLTEYSDFQCPACATYHPLLKQLTKDYGDRVAFVYRHFPLRQIHRAAQLAGQAAEAASLQGKFWEMHDLLFEQQTRWSSEIRPIKTFTSYAKQLGLDVVKFEADLESDKVEEIVNNDYSGGLGAGVNSTPTFAINGQIIRSPSSYDEFKKIIDAALLAE